jgi:hypothetical protein
MRPQSASKRAPEYELNRIVKVADSTRRIKQLGCNFGPSQAWGMIQVVPINTDSPPENLQSVDLLTGATSNPVVNILFWNDALGIFIPRTPALGFTAQGAGVATEYEVAAAARILMVEVASGVTAGQGVLIFCSGHSLSDGYS